jgi:Fe2+ or Zn2+ uptake regulation protein
MRQYKLKETKEINKIFCNKCGKEIAMNHGRLEEDVLSVDKRWGYFSNKDNQVDSFDLCEKCYDEFVATFTIPIGE